MSELKSYTDLHKTIVAFLDEIIDMFPKEGDFVALRIMVNDRFPVTSIVKHFQKSILPEKELIRKRDKSFFYKNTLFVPFGDVRSKKLQNIFHNMDEEDRTVIWRWFDAFVTLTEKCV
jgi:hypothetical protein